MLRQRLCFVKQKVGVGGRFVRCGCLLLVMICNGGFAINHTVSRLSASFIYILCVEIGVEVEVEVVGL